MINISEIVATWREADGWRISPGVDWCAEGGRVVVGVGCTAGDGFHVGDGFQVGNRFQAGGGFQAGEGFQAGDDFRAGDDFHVGEGSQVGNRFQAGEGFQAGDWFRAGDNFRAGDGFHVGNWFRAGNDATGIAHIGYADGYAIALSAVGQVAYIGGGCRWLPLAAALRHVDGREDRKGVQCLLESAKALAELHKLRWE